MEAVRTGLRNILNDLLRACPPEEVALVAWPLVCGKEVAARSRAVNFSNGNLTVEVADAVWRSQLQSFASRYVNGYQELLGPLVQRIEFKVQQPAISNPHSGKRKEI